ncbi:hypothetical protein GGR53DRAFT_518515 [Hypoxylon sp. FL1150]|nr:hypothetical protein GGR53DRAFT_518515 [Hypoxylon sp. FL1150]
MEITQTTLYQVGGNRGIGYAIVYVAGTRIRDATVLVGCRAVEIAEESIRRLKELGVRAKLEPLETNITDDASIKAAVKTVGERYRKLDVLVTKAFLPLLRKAEWGRAIMISSARGSISRTKSFEVPPTQHWMYNCSKAALNLVIKETDRITFWTASPGHCKTAFNNFRGFKDPLEGAEVIARLLEARRYEIPAGTSWKFEQGNFQQVPW